MSNLILRTTNSPYGDFNKGSVLSQTELDNNFIHLKGQQIQSASTSGTSVTLTKFNGDIVSFDTQAAAINASFWVTGTGIYSIYTKDTGSVASGNYSLAEGGGTNAIGNYSHAEGNITNAIGIASHAEGLDTVAIGNYSHAEGNITYAIGTSSHAEGFQTTASGGDGSHAEGNYTIASGTSSHAEGSGTVAGGNNSHAEGDGAIASGLGSHAEGGVTKAIGFYTHAEGDATQAIGDISHAEGYGTKAIGDYSHVEGRFSTASGTSSHAEGSGTTAGGDYSHAGGHNSIASGNTSFVHGNGSTAGGTNTIVLGANIIGLSPNTTYVDNFNIKTLGGGSSVNNLGIDSNGNVVVGSVGGSGMFTGGTVSGPTTFTGGLTANTISATTITATNYVGLPKDIYVTGGTYNNGTITLARSSGSPITINGLTSGGTVSGGTVFTNGLTANTLNIQSLVAGISVNNLGIDSSGRIIIGSSGGTNLKYYSEFSATPATSPIVLSANSIAIGDGAQARDEDMFVVGYQAGKSATGSNHSTFIGRDAGNNASGSSYSNFVGSNAGLYASNNIYSNIIGFEAGVSASDIISVNFIGTGAGGGAIGSSESNFIGYGAGTDAVNANDSNFIGYFAGNGATGTSYSNLIGYKVGAVDANDIDLIGSGNTIIGTNITLPSGTTNGLNIGGVLFGKDIQADVNSLTPLDSASPNGKIGINVVNPTEALDVSGNTKISGSISVSGVTFNKLLLEKSGVVAGASFAGTPKIASVTFASSFPNTNYVIMISGENERLWTSSAKTNSGFIINSGADTAFTGNVYWFAKQYGEV